MTQLTEQQVGPNWERTRRLLAATKLYWGLGALFLVGVLSSPVSSKGNNIFLSYGNLADVFRQVSVTGITAVGMTICPWAPSWPWDRWCAR
jgi:simple sugar transport system permease protein